MADCNFSDVSRLLKAPSKDAVLKTCQTAYLYSSRRIIPDTVIQNVSSTYSVNEKEAKGLMLSLGSLLKTAVFQGTSQPADIIQLFPNDFHKSLRDMLAKIIIENHSTWRAQAVNNQGDSMVMNKVLEKEFVYPLPDDKILDLPKIKDIADVSLPQMIDFDWRVDIKTSSDSIARMSVPTCILQMKVQDNPTRVDQVPDVSNVNVELSKETLDTMLDGLSKIRDQLSSVANR